MDLVVLTEEIVKSLVENTDAVSVKEFPTEEENLHDSTYMVYCDESDVARLIGKKGIVAEAIRDVANVSAKLNNKKIRIKFEAKK